MACVTTAAATRCAHCVVERRARRNKLSALLQPARRWRAHDPLYYALLDTRRQQPPCCSGRGPWVAARRPPLPPPLGCRQQGLAPAARPIRAAALADERQSDEDDSWGQFEDDDTWQQPVKRMDFVYMSAAEVAAAEAAAEAAWAEGMREYDALQVGAGRCCCGQLLLLLRSTPLLLLPLLLGLRAAGALLRGFVAGHWGLLAPDRTPLSTRPPARCRSGCCSAPGGLACCSAGTCCLRQMERWVRRLPPLVRRGVACAGAGWQGEGSRGSAAGPGGGRFSDARRLAGWAAEAGGAQVSPPADVSAALHMRLRCVPTCPACPLCAAAAPPCAGRLSRRGAELVGSAVGHAACFAHTLVFTPRVSPRCVRPPCAGRLLRAGWLRRGLWVLQVAHRRRKPPAARRPHPAGGGRCDARVGAAVPAATRGSGTGGRAGAGGDGIQGIQGLASGAGTQSPAASLCG